MVDARRKPLPVPVTVLTEERMAALISQALAEDGISQAEFCRRVGVTTKHLNTVLQGKATARLQALDYWAFVLGRRFVVTLERAQSGRPLGDGDGAPLDQWEDHRFLTQSGRG